MTAAYRAELDLYSGPMDLLLYLVRKNEIAVREVSLAEIAIQYRGFLDILERIDLESVGEFLVVASTLMETKSREAMPQEPEPEVAEATETEDRSGLIQRLIEYRRYKDAAKALEESAAEWQERFPRLSDERPRIGKNPAVDFIREVELWDLVSALSRVIRRGSVDHEVGIVYDDTPIHVHVERIGERVRKEGRLGFTSLFDGDFHRSRIAGMFLAVLELLRHHRFRAEQPVDFGEIWVLPPLDSPVSLTIAELSSVQQSRPDGDEQ